MTSQENGNRSTTRVDHSYCVINLKLPSRLLLKIDDTNDLLHRSIEQYVLIAHTTELAAGGDSGQQ